MSTKRQGPPKHQNRFSWQPHAGHKINPTEVGGRLRPYSDITGVCQRCKDQIDWKRRYGKYKPLSHPAKCQRCSKRAVRQAYHNLCPGCAKEQRVCAKCCCGVDHIVGRDSAEVDAEQKMLENAIKNARERDRRTLLRAMNKGKSKSSTKPPSNEGNKVGDLFPDSSLDEYAAKNRVSNHNVTGHNVHVVREDCEEEKEEDDDNDDIEDGEFESEAENEEDKDGGGYGHDTSDDFREANIEGGLRSCQNGLQQVALSGPPPIINSKQTTV